MKSLLLALGLWLGVALVAAVAFVYSGFYNVGADQPHWDVTARVLETLRTQSLERRARQVSSVPNLEDHTLIAQGAGQYAAMCVSCHLAPGMAATELSKGLYPTPPPLARNPLDPKVAYTVIKHGIKMSGMPAWGGHHGDEQVWSLVAFVTKLPGMTPQQYQEYVRSPAANAAAAMASHGGATMMMPQVPASGAASAGSHGPPGHHDAPGTSAAAGSTGAPPSGSHGPPGHHDTAVPENRK